MVPLESPGEGCVEVGWSLHLSLPSQTLASTVAASGSSGSLFKKQIPSPNLRPRSLQLPAQPRGCDLRGLLELPQGPEVKHEPFFPCRGPCAPAAGNAHLEPQAQPSNFESFHANRFSSLSRKKSVRSQKLRGSWDRIPISS